MTMRIGELVGDRLRRRIRLPIRVGELVGDRLRRRIHVDAMSMRRKPTDGEQGKKEDSVGKRNLNNRVEVDVDTGVPQQQKDEAASSISH